MRINEFLILGWGPGTRSELNYLLILPFIILVFEGLSLSFVLTLFSLSHSPPFWQRNGVLTQGEGVLWKSGGKGNDNS